MAVLCVDLMTVHVFISIAVAWGWGSCGFHGLDEFTEVSIYDEMGC